MESYFPNYFSEAFSIKLAFPSDGGKMLYIFVCLKRSAYIFSRKKWKVKENLEK